MEKEIKKKFTWSLPKSIVIPSWKSGATLFVAVLALSGMSITQSFQLTPN